MKPCYLTILLLAAGALQVNAQPAYRSVDEQGNVTFSDTPVPGAVDETRININPPTPSPAELEQRRQQATEIMDTASQGTTPAAPDKAAQREAANRALKEAEKQLEEARSVREGDRIGTASGGSRLTQRYLDRVHVAEENVERAREQLKALQ